jgi:hypothetical protein
MAAQGSPPQWSQRPFHEQLLAVGTAQAVPPPEQFGAKIA